MRVTYLEYLGSVHNLKEEFFFPLGYARALGLRHGGITEEGGGSETNIFTLCNLGMAL